MTTTTEQNKIEDLKKQLVNNQNRITAQLEYKVHLQKSLEKAILLEINTDKDLTLIKNDHLGALKATMMNIDKLQATRAELKEQKRALTTCEHCGRHS